LFDWKERVDDTGKINEHLCTEPCVTTSRETLQALQLVTRAGENLRHDDEGKPWEWVKSGGF
jgi:hypothetical protein